MLVNDIFDFSKNVFYSSRGKFQFLKHCLIGFFANTCIFYRPKVFLYGKYLSLYQNTIFLHLSKLKAFADNKINVVQNLKFVSGRIETIVGKGENAGYPHFLLFPQCFLEASFSRSIRVEIVW